MQGMEKQITSKGKQKYKCCTGCYKNFSAKIWDANNGCPNCKWLLKSCNFIEAGLVKTGSPYPCYILNDGNILINNKAVEIIN